MRGKQLRVFVVFVYLRNIPAYAGKTVSSKNFIRCFPEHPRVCGENLFFVFLLLMTPGTSPRMRGKLDIKSVTGAIPGNIPAYAGKTLMNTNKQIQFAEHPRVCGENSYSSIAIPIAHGTSPRMRGKPVAEAARRAKNRNIPAYAGKTPTKPTTPTHGGEHPRVCGENHVTRGTHSVWVGTSPRMRGKPPPVLALW